MAIYQKANTGADIINGLATVAIGGAVPLYYDPPGQSQHLASGDSLTHFITLNGRYLSDQWALEHGVQPPASGEASSPAGNSAATVTYPAEGPGRRHVLYGLGWSYTSDPAAGATVKVTSGPKTLFGPHAITTGGPGFFQWSEGLKGDDNQDMVLTLSAGGAGVTGVISAMGHRVE